MQYSVSRVECLRQMMHITAFNKGVSHPDVLVISRRLDEAINGLYKVAISDYPHPYSPIVYEICTGVGLSSSSTAHSHLIKLEEQGYIVRKPNCPMCLVLTERRL